MTVAAGSVATLTIGNVLTAAGYRTAAVAFAAAIPDQLEPGRRGPASAHAQRAGDSATGSPAAAVVRITPPHPPRSEAG